MKTTYELGSDDLKAALIPYMLAVGKPVSLTDDFTVDAQGNVTIVVTTPPLVVIKVSPPATQAPIVSPSPPLVPTAPAVPTDRARCDAFTAGFTFPAECAYHHGGSRIPEDVISEDVPGDDGGLTKWGIDQASHAGVDIQNLSMQQALDIYYAEWTQQKCNLLPSPIAEVVHDTFESGGHPVQWLQQVLGVTVDGQLGPVTAAAAHAAPGKTVALAFLERRDVYFNELADTVGHDAQFRKGWLNRDQNLRKYLGLV
jgi:hypothetical protein